MSGRVQGPNSIIYSLYPFLYFFYGISFYCPHTLISLSPIMKIKTTTRGRGGGVRGIRGKILIQKGAAADRRLPHQIDNKVGDDNNDESESESKSES